MEEWQSDQDAKCPFFRAHTRDSVLCEGAMPDSRATHRFLNIKDKEIQYSVFCCGKYENCEMYRAVREKYGAEE